MTLELTAVFQEVPEGFIGFVEELPGANVQEPTLDEAREALREAVEQVLAANRASARATLTTGTVIREPLQLDAA